MFATNLFVALSFITIVISEICEKPLNIKIIVYHDVNGDVKNFTSEGAITVTEDVFQLLVANQTIKQLCQNYIIINNELTVLQLLNNSIEDIVPSAFNISATLALLKISRNPLNTIRKGVFNDVKTKELDLSNNNIATIEADALENNTHLEIIKLNNNLLKEFDPQWFVKTPNVYKFSAIHNDITKLPPYAFAHMANDRPLKIRISANRIYEIHPNALAGAGTIDTLRLSGNKLKELPPQLFLNRTIKNLQVSSNRLTCFPDTLFNSTVVDLEFSENPSFDCFCLMKVRNFVLEQNVTILYPSIICEDKKHEINVVFNENKSYAIPLLSPSLDSDPNIK